VDEYATEFDLPRRSSIRPLTLGQLIALIDGVTPTRIGHPLFDGNQLCLL